jgi:hypothetical protein
MWMRELKQLTLILMLTAFFGCASENVLTKEEIKAQSAADWEVASLLFNRGLTKSASYNVRKSGLVVIKFDKSVNFNTYNDIIQALRSNPAIDGVRGEQEGKEVCPL